MVYFFIIVLLIITVSFIDRVISKIKEIHTGTDSVKDAILDSDFLRNTTIDIIVIVFCIIKTIDYLN